MEGNNDKRAIDRIRDIAKKQKELKNKINKVKLFIKALPFILKGVIILCIFIITFSLTMDIWGMIKSSTTPTVIYSSLEVEDLAELVVIKGDSSSGYYLTFSDDAEEKISKAAEALESTSGAESEISEELLKKFIKAQVVTQFPDLGGTVQDGTDQFQGAVKIRRITPDKNYGEMKNTSDGEETKEEIAYIGTDVVDTDKTDNYTIGIMAGYSTDSPGARSPEPKSGEVQLKEEELTIKVADYIKQALSIYSNINIVEIGSTKSNPNVSNEGRLQTAKAANVNALIGIQFNSSGDGTEYTDDSGITVAYNADGGSETSQRLGNILKETVSSKMTLSELISNQTDISNTLGTKEDSFPSLIIKGGYLTSKKDYSVLSTEYGLQNYAKGVADGILKYFGIENKGYGTIIQGTNSISSTINSNVVDLKYVPMEDFEKHIADNSEEALKEFSLDENKKLVTATWTYENGTLSISKNSGSTDYKSVIDKYTMPIEYLINWYIYTRHEGFVSDLAQLALDSSYILMLEDNVTTTQVDTVTSEYVEEYERDDNGEYTIAVNDPEWKEISNTQEFTEKASSKFELIYVDTWFMKFTNNLLIDQESNKVQKANGTVKNNNTESETQTIESEEWTEKITVSKVTKKKNIENIKFALVPGGIDDEQYEGLDNEPANTGNSGSTPSSPNDDPQYEGQDNEPANTGNSGSNSSGSNDDPQYEGQDEEIEESKEETVYYKRDTTTKVVTKTNAISNQYKSEESEVTANEKKFIDIFNKDEEIKATLQDGWLIRALEADEKTANMVDLTKYLLYKATGVDYGVISFDFSEYEPSTFSMTTGIYGGTIQEKVWFALRDLGYSEIVVAGAMGNIDHESGGFDLSAVEKGVEKGGIGLIQWTGGRRTQLEEYAKSKGVGWEDEDTQIEFLVTEITGQGEAIGFANQRKAGYILEEGVRATSDDWANATNIEDSTLYFMRFFESPKSKSSYQTRLEAAYRYAEEFKGRTKPTGSASNVDGGDGYSQIYISSSGKQYKEYKQYEGSYSGQKFMPYGDPISSIGCSITSIAITLTGYGKDVNPGNLANHNYLAQHYSEYGISATRVKGKPESSEEIIENLKEGRPIVVEISGELKSGGATKYYPQHFIAVLDINSEGQIYISDPGSTSTNGWANADDLVSITKSVLYVNE